MPSRASRRVASHRIARTQAAEVLSKRFESRFGKLTSGREALAGGSGGGKRSRSLSAKSAGRAEGAPTCKARRRLTRYLKSARMENITAAVHAIDRCCPAALSCDGDWIDVDVDSLDGHTFSVVERFVVPPDLIARTSRSTANGRSRKRVAPHGEHEANEEVDVDAGAPAVKKPSKKARAAGEDEAQAAAGAASCGEPAHDADGGNVEAGGGGVGPVASPRMTSNGEALAGPS